MWGSGAARVPHIRLPQNCHQDVLRHLVRMCVSGAVRPTHAPRHQTCHQEGGSTPSADVRLQCTVPQKVGILCGGLNARTFASNVRECLWIPGMGVSEMHDAQRAVFPGGARRTHVPLHPKRDHECRWIPTVRACLKRTLPTIVRTPPEPHPATKTPFGCLVRAWLKCTMPFFVGLCFFNSGALSGGRVPARHVQFGWQKTRIEQHFSPPSFPFVCGTILRVFRCSQAMRHAGRSLSAPIPFLCV